MSGKRFRLPSPLRIALIPLSLYLLLVGLLFFFQRELQYYPVPSTATPQDVGLENVYERRLSLPDGTQVQAWYALPQGDRPLLVYFHGNGGNLTYRARGRFAPYLKAGFGLIAVSYPGYGSSEGQPTEASIYAAAQAALDYALKDQGYGPSQLVYYGESLGTGVALEMATRTAPYAIVLESPYTSVAERAQEMYFWVPVEFLLKDRFDSQDKINQTDTPILIMHGEEDRVIPLRHAQKLHKIAANHSRLQVFEGYGHGDFDAVDLLATMLPFLEEIVANDR